MVILGVILLVVGLLVPNLSILITIGIILILVGALLWFVPLGGRTRRWY